MNISNSLSWTIIRAVVAFNLLAFLGASNGSSASHMDPRPDSPARCLALTPFAVTGCPIRSYHEIRVVHLQSRGSNLLLFLSSCKIALGISILWWWGVVGNHNRDWMLVALKAKIGWSAVSQECSGLHGVQCPAHTTASLASMDIWACLHGNQKYHGPKHHENLGSSLGCTVQ